MWSLLVSHKKLLLHWQNQFKKQKRQKFLKKRNQNKLLNKTKTHFLRMKRPNLRELQRPIKLTQLLRWNSRRSAMPNLAGEYYFGLLLACLGLIGTWTIISLTLPMKLAMLNNFLKQLSTARILINLALM